MANTIKIKNSGTASTAPTSLVNGELAINYADGKLYYKNSSNVISNGKFISSITGTSNQVSVSETTGAFTISLPSTISISGNIVAGTDLISNYSVGDEGGEIQLAKPQTNTSINTAVIIDIYQNKLRIFESGGTNRGAYIDLTAANTGVGSNLLGGGGSSSLSTLSDVTITSAVSTNHLEYNGTKWVNSTTVRDNYVRFIMEVI